MPKKRLIFTLLYQEKSFWLSRNFRLQRVGDINWLQKNYEFSRVAQSIDELIILDVSREDSDEYEFLDAVASLSQDCFMPISLGGGINTIEKAELYIKNGADKLIINTALTSNPSLITDLVRIYGSQCIIASVDLKNENRTVSVCIDRARTVAAISFEDYLDSLISLGVGEIYLNDIKRDGTGQGYDLTLLDQYFQGFPLPVILAGGVGNADHLLEGILVDGVDAVSTANLFNFMGDGLPNARKYLLANQVDLALW